MVSKAIKQLIKLFSLILCFILPAQSKEFVVGWELWYPYQFHNNESKLTGVDVEIFNLIAKKADMTISYVELPWQRHLMYIQNGMVDIAFGASHTEERAKTAHFSLGYRKEKVNLFVKKGTKNDIKLNKLADLIASDYLIGVENGYYYGENYEKLKHSPEFMAQISSVLDIEQNVKMLLKGHINGFLADPFTMQSFIEKYQFKDQFEIHPLPIYQSDIYIMLSKKTCAVEDLAKINQAITTLQNEGKLAEIIQRWSTKH